MRILLDQNVPGAVAAWFRANRPDWMIQHVNEVSLSGQPDEAVYRWAQMHEAVVITFDEHFADARFYPLGSHHGIVRLRTWPTTTESTVEALERLLLNIPESIWARSLIIVDNKKIRVRQEPGR
jgi:predicted nuclease of predicted toxin-antitoxin system